MSAQSPGQKDSDVLFADNSLVVVLTGWSVLCFQGQRSSDELCVMFLPLLGVAG